MWNRGALYTGLGRLAARPEAPVPQGPTHADEVGEHGFLSSGVIDWQAHGGSAWARQHLLSASFGDGGAVLCEGVQALKRVELTRNEGWAFSFVNDLHNGGQREVVDAWGRAHTVTAAAAGLSAVDLGDGCVVEGKMAVRASDALQYVSPGRRLRKDNGFASAQWDRLVVPGRIGTIRKREWLQPTRHVAAPAHAGGGRARTPPAAAL